MPSKTFLVKSNNDSCNFPGSPTLSKSTVALRSRGTVPGTRSPQGVTAQHACAQPGPQSPLPHPSVVRDSKRSGSAPGLPDEPHRRVSAARPACRTGAALTTTGVPKVPEATSHVPPRLILAADLGGWERARRRRGRAERLRPLGHLPSPDNPRPPQQLAELGRGSSRPDPPLPEAGSQGPLSKLPSPQMLQLVASVHPAPRSKSSRRLRLKDFAALHYREITTVGLLKAYRVILGMSLPSSLCLRDNHCQHSWSSALAFCSRCPLLLSPTQ